MYCGSSGLALVVVLLGLCFVFLGSICLKTLPSFKTKMRSTNSSTDGLCVIKITVVSFNSLNKVRD